MTLLGLLWGVASEGFLIGAAAAAMALLLRLSSAAIRQQVWVVAVTLMVLVPIGLAVRWHGEARPNLETSMAALAGSKTRLPPDFQWTQDPNGPATAVGPGTWTPDTSSRRLALVLLWVWAVPAALLLVRLMVGVLVAERRVRRSPLLDDPAWGRALAEACATVGLNRPPVIRVSAAVSSPLTVGLLRPAIMLPGRRRGGPDGVTLDPTDDLASEAGRRAILVHECAHIVRHDVLLGVVGRLAVAIHWFNPLAWLAVRQLELLGERASDDHVLSAGIRPSAYIRQLMVAAEPAGSRWFVPAVGLRSGLGRRVEAVANGALPRRSLGRRAQAALLTLTVATVPILVGLAPDPPTRPGEDLVTIRLGEGEALFLPTGGTFVFEGRRP